MRVIGLMSGTSADGVDAALVEVRRRAGGVAARLVALESVPYPTPLRRRLLAAASGTALGAGEVALLGQLLGERFADAVRAVCRRARVASGAVDLVGCHGHTLHHDPAGARVSLQVGEAAIIAVGTGITTVADFRPADVAAGGEGAPLVPLAHACLFRDHRRGRAVQNLGGIGNVTYLPPGRGLTGVVAFDTGPGNIVVDALVRRLSQGRRWFDAGGARAGRGRVDEGFVAELLRHPFFRRRPPRSTGRELFGEEYVDAFVAAGRRRRLGDDDLVATATALTAASCADAYRRFLARRGRLDEVLLCGGGAANRTLVGMLRRMLPRAVVRATADVGVPTQAVEAVAFALLAVAAAFGIPATCPRRPAPRVRSCSARSFRGRTTGAWRSRAAPRSAGPASLIVREALGAAAELTGRWAAVSDLATAPMLPQEVVHG